MKRIRILLADDHALVSAGLRKLLEAIPDLEVVAEAADGREAIELVRHHQPDVVLMDVAMPGLNGLDAAARLSKEAPAVRVIILSMHQNEEYVVRALRAGAAGYLVKTAAITEVAAAVRTVQGGQTYLSPAVSRHVVFGYLKRVGGVAGLLELLTPRQREVLQLIAEGHSTKEIAVRLGLSVKTIDTHRTQLMERLDLHDVAGLVRYAIGTGLVAAGR